MNRPRGIRVSVHTVTLCTSLILACLFIPVSAAGVFDAFAAAPVTFVIEDCGIETLVIMRDGDTWRIREVLPPVTVTAITTTETSDLDPDLARMHIAFSENHEEGILRIWFDKPTERGGLPKPFFAELKGETILVQDWDVSMRQGSAEPIQPDRDQVALWVYEHGDRMQDVSFVAVVADHIWHHQHLDSPPGSFNRIIDLNRRIIELRPHHADTYSTTAWLLWSKWVTWSMHPERMPDGETKLDEALELLEAGEKQNPRSADFLFQAGTVLMPVARHHKPELTERVESYLRRAAETAGDGPLAVATRRTLAAHYFRHNQPALAQRWYRKLLEADPDNTVAKQRLEELRAAGEPATE